MKVKIGELKTHFSRYLRQLRESGEPIEVCAREEPVAYLTAARGGGPGLPDEWAGLQRDLAEVGLAMTGPAVPGERPGDFLPAPSRAGDGRADIGTVRQMREERDY